MINGLEGIPGSGKSYEAVVFHVLQALKRGRLVITNLPLDLESFGAINPDWLHLIEIRTKPLQVRGTWDAERVPAFQLFAPGEKAREESPFVTDGRTATPRQGKKIFGHVWDFYTEWKADDGSGPLYIIDECHVGLPKIGTDAEVIEWYKLHRHFNADVLLGTQNFRDVDQSVAGLLAMLIRVRKADILGRKDSYIRKVFAGYRGAVISTDERKYQTQYFCLYKSHTQGNSVSESMASDVTPMLVQFNRFKWGWFLFSVIACVYAFWPSEPKKSTVSKPSDQWAAIKALEQAAALPAVPASGAVVVASSPNSPASAPAIDLDPEPFKDQKIHLTGWMTAKGFSSHTFSVSFSGSRLFDLTKFQLLNAGYTFVPLTDCAGLIRWRDRVRTVICDSPAFASGSNAMPVVVGDTSGKSSNDSRRPVQEPMPPVNSRLY